jgi:shikimate kinase
MKIFLIGYMGSGKSTIGQLLSEKLGMDFIDFDKHIEQETGKTIPEIFDTEGEEKFRALEHEYLKNLLNKDHVVISLGGGTPCFHNNIELINKNGTSVYIEMSVDALLKRLSNARNKRPLIRNLNEVDMKYFIETNLEKRLPVYRQAHLSVCAENLSVEQLAEVIIQSVKRTNQKN